MEELLLGKILASFQHYLSRITHYYLGFHGNPKFLKSQKMIKPIRKIRIKPEIDHSSPNRVDSEELIDRIYNRDFLDSKMDSFTQTWVDKLGSISEVESLPDSGLSFSSFNSLNVDQDKPVLNDSYFEDDYINDLIGKENHSVKIDSLHQEAIKIKLDLNKISHKTKDLLKKSDKIVYNYE